MEERWSLVGGLSLGLRDEKNPAPGGAAYLFRGNLYRLKDKKQILVRGFKKKKKKKQSPLVPDDQGMILACSTGH